MIQELPAHGDSALLIRPEPPLMADTSHEKQQLTDEREAWRSPPHTLLHFLLGGSLLPPDPLCS